ncbi:hypothetical protein [Desulfosporosinus metallidurans]|uniref:Uncharacterized protein n=1 Tax=Desulfosporosinus metallidurans TaxID=1888891 RepID=A0A1Q8QNS5_9FIRM|nr:hypothetical protein [Desulfosporosinus metallidurans]OLN28976.1 hypothetical protein DSOL_3787 [Desulfosporosinus metallidurans]
MKKCIECKCLENLVPIFKRGSNNGTAEDYSRKMICEDCLENYEEYGRCPLCQDEAAYHERDLIDGYCREHYDEVTPYDEEEAEDKRSYAEYLMDPSH